MSNAIPENHGVSTTHTPVAEIKTPPWPLPLRIGFRFVFNYLKDPMNTLPKIIHLALLPALLLPVHPTAEP